MTHFDVIIIGAGAAGLMCAIQAGQRGRSVLVLEKSNKAGRKILISGGGRCNFTNLYTEPDCYLSHNPHFCKSALSRYTQWDFIGLVEKHGLSWTEKTLGQLFCDQKAGAIVDMLLAECREADVKVELNSEVDTITKHSNETTDDASQQFTIITQERVYTANSLVIASGGPSIPKMGATDFGLRVAKQFNLNTYPFTAALVPFTFPEKELELLFRELSGTAVDVILTVNNTSFKEAILFTHRGLSGPATLQISSYWRLGDSISVNLLPEHNAEDWLMDQQVEHPNAELKTLLARALPKRLAARLCELFIASKPMKQYTPNELQTIATQLSEWELKPHGTEGMRTAEVALGGVDCNELSSKTMESKKISHLYFIGESVDVTGHLGGYNFQWAWASGWCAGQYV
ncbi:NAD(P)/FAD-dependent oxidoreductase [Leucothrix pacifica]|uniref:Aminoacetone oxidase family FAD-binding enzyme n=1 Tax=Leucothrix pacifica TaxID=1247513 RepID=A0A317CP11_9GAMM|nr:NAD(P)/FAD-dependent oxidoreductase [Leucothrix pacifica]PWR00080.1 aminoacetone oxidase family FAD-binding enzyme [Leucothrix pacifica]